MIGATVPASERRPLLRGRAAARRAGALASAFVAVAALAACGSISRARASHRSPGQIADDAVADPARALVIARIRVITDGEPGFGPIGNPLLLQLAEGSGIPSAKAGTLTIPDLNPLSVNDPAAPYYTGAYGPMLWHYASPGLLAASVQPGIYDALLAYYPDVSRTDRPVDSIPAPDRSLVFAPLPIEGGSIVYLGDIDIRQRITWADRLLDRVRMAYVVRDRYAATTAEFRARYPQFHTAHIEDRTVSPAP